ncbi:hypothetical protein I3842_11G099300 [Carya illinoinensis]|uniref:Uncharacterized protein n=1 Tax=Carya illinoinensis TaxID=32201 RepID=A0A922DNY3_CARIL|nr:hypothetical protein I3842_11G099300 [Carya illinoinensis]
MEGLKQIFLTKLCMIIALMALIALVGTTQGQDPCYHCDLNYCDAHRHRPAHFGTRNLKRDFGDLSQSCVFGVVPVL